MYCHHCGNKLNNNDKFCGRCGSKVPKRSATSSNDTAVKKPSGSPNKIASKDASDSTSEVKNANPSNFSVHNELIPETVNTAPKNNRVDSEDNSLKAAVAFNRKRSRRKMPLILVVALVLALASSVAYAAYYVYTQIYLPQQETVQQVEQQPEEEIQNEEAWASALDTYQPVIDEYKRAFDTSSSTEWGFRRFNDSDHDYQYANTNGLLGMGIETIYYALEDLDSDGTPELLVARSINGDSSVNGIQSLASLYGIYAISNGEIEIANNNIWERNTLHYLGNNLFLEYGSGGMGGGILNLLTWSHSSDPQEYSADGDHALYAAPPKMEILASYEWELISSGDENHEEIYSFEETGKYPRKGTFSWSELQQCQTDFVKEYFNDSFLSEQIIWEKI